MLCQIVMGVLNEDAVAPIIGRRPTTGECNETMIIKPYTLLITTLLIAFNAHADNSTLDAAIGGGIGGATGAAIGNEVGGRDGAILGGALGAAVGTAITTDDGGHQAAPPQPTVRYETGAPKGGHPQEYHCPPGQRKKGRC